ncbi:hypothetical protein WJX77_006003 [Trebouxia sp. C0004]
MADWLQDVRTLARTLVVKLQHLLAEAPAGSLQLTGVLGLAALVYGLYQLRGPGRRDDDAGPPAPRASRGPSTSTLTQQPKQAQSSSASQQARTSAPTTLAQAVQTQLAGVRQMTISAPGVLLDQWTPDQLQDSASVRQQAVPLLLELAKNANVFLITHVIDDVGESTVRGALEDVGLVGASEGQIKPHRLVFCSTLEGKVSIVRQLEPELHIDGHPATVEDLKRFMPQILHIIQPGSQAAAVGNKNVGSAGSLAEPSHDTADELTATPDSLFECGTTPGEVAMSRPRSKKELEEAGRRKLEAFRKQKATAKSLHSVPKADAELHDSPRVTSQASSSAKPVSSDTSLTRAASVLPVSTSAQPVSTGGSEEDIGDVSRLNLSAAFAGSSQAAKSDAPVQQAASPSASLVHIPFTGITAGNGSSRQLPTPQAAPAATVSAPSTYRSRLPPPPPVFKALASRPQASVLQSSSRATGLSVNPLPWSPALLKGVSNQANTLSKGQPAGSIPTFLRPSISQFHPATPGFVQNNATSQHQEQASTSGRDAAGSYSSIELSNGAISSLVLSPSAAAHTDATEAASEATSSPGAQTASHLSLLDERQLIPGVSTGQTEEVFPHTEAFEAVAQERDASPAGSPVGPEALTSSLKMLKESARLAAEAHTPDSPLVFPWSQGPNSTGAASAYASLSDSYLSRPTSQTPSQAPSQGPSPSKRAQHGVPSPSSPQHARRDAAFAASRSQHAQHDTELSNPYGAATKPTSPDPSLHAQHTQQAVQMVPSTASPLAASSPAAQPHIDTLTPSGAASFSVEARSAQSVSNQANPLPENSVPAAAQHTLQLAQLPPQGAFKTLVQHTQQRRHQALEGQGFCLDALHQSGAMTRDAAEQLLRDTPPQHDTAQGSECLPLPDVPSANGFSNRQADLVRVASSSSGNGSSGGDSSGGHASSAAADGLRHGIGRVSGSLPSLYTGLGSHASLAESVANGTVPAKASNFTQLQQHIDDLTKEKFELVRGLKEHQKMAAGLSEENLLLTKDFNRQAEALQQTRKQLRELKMGVQEQQHSLDQLAAERDACMSAAHESADRSKSLAAEVVALEEKMLQVRSREIRLEKETGRLTEGLQQAEQQLQSSRQDRASLQATIDVLQEEKASLLVKLRQAASRSDAAAVQAAAAEMPRASSQQAEAMPDRSQHQHQQQTALALVPAAAAAESSAQSETPGESASFRRSSNAGASTSARLADQALAMHHARHQQQQVATNSLQGGLSQSLAKLLPKGPGAAEQQQMVESIHAMIGELEVEKQSFLATMNSQQAQLHTLTAVNSELQRKLESQTQRLELAIQQQAHASPHAATAASPSAFVNGSAITAMRPQLQQAPPQLQQAPPQLSQAAPQLQSGRRTSGVLGWLGHVIAPRPSPQQANLLA